MKQETLNKYLNTTHGVLTILELDHEEYDKSTQCKRSYFKCKCNRCGSITVVRTDRFGKGKYIPKSCSNCINNLQKEIADKKYKEDRPGFYCGEENANGIDRVDSTKHYTKENCVPCCFICNRMKNKYSINVFLEKIKQIYHNHNESSTTISKESTLQANGSGNGELLTAYLR